MSKKRPSLYHGLLLVDKPAGLSSHDVVAVIRRLAGQRRVGHSGTLDPLATGLLVLLLGEATRLEPYLVKMDKLYTGRLELGLSTDSNDIDGNILARLSGPWPTEEEMEVGLKAKEGERQQVPPAFSAIKLGGRRAYQAARAGEPLELKARLVTAFSLKLNSYHPPEAEFSAEVSSGYYIRSLVRDLGDEMALGAALTALRRHRVGFWSVKQAYTLDEIKNWASAEWPEKILLPTEALPHWPEIVLTPLEQTFFRQGRSLAAPNGQTPGEYKIMDEQGRLIGLARILSEEENKDSSFGKANAASFGGSSPWRPYLRPLRVFNFGLVAELPIGKE